MLLEIGGPQPADLNAEHHREPAYDLVILPPWFSDTSRGTDPPLQILLNTNVEYVITTSNYRSRYESIYAQQRFPGITEAWHDYYSFLDSSTDVVYEIEPGSLVGSDDLVGPLIRIYRIGENAR